MPSQAEVKHYRLVQWELSKRYPNEILDEDPEYTFDSITDREYRYECSITSCRSMWDLRMTPSGLFCASHYLPWLHLDSNGNREELTICYSAGCLEPAVSTLFIDHPACTELNGKKLREVFLCRNHQLPPISDERVAWMAEQMCQISLSNPTILGANPADYSFNEYDIF